MARDWPGHPSSLEQTTAGYWADFLKEFFLKVRDRKDTICHLLGLPLETVKSALAFLSHTLTPSRHRSDPVGELEPRVTHVGSLPHPTHIERAVWMASASTVEAEPRLAPRGRWTPDPLSESGARGLGRHRSAEKCQASAWAGDSRQGPGHSLQSERKACGHHAGNTSDQNGSHREHEFIANL